MRFAPPLAAALLLALSAPPLHAHGDEHGPSAAPAAATHPRTEAASEDFELVATLHDDALILLVDRYASNEPVLAAKLSVESDGIQAAARFRAEQGDYRVDDPRLLDLLRRPGAHALLFTLVAGADSDLLDASLQVAEAAPAHPSGRRGLFVAVAAGLSLLGLAAWLWRRSRKGGL